MILSPAGNRFPPGLKPMIVTIDQTSSGPVPNAFASDWAKPPEPVDHSHLVTAEKFLYQEMPQGDPWPRFKIRLWPKQDDETDEQYASYRAAIEQHTYLHGVYLGLLRMLCEEVGNPRRCREAACRRRRRCRARRDEDSFCISIAVFPACIPLDPDVIETYRMAVPDLLERYLAGCVAGPEALA